MLGCVVAACRTGRNAEADSGPYLQAVQAALRSGDLKRAEEVLEEAREVFPRDSSVRLWSSQIASMRWDDAGALADLEAVRASGDYGGFSREELEGKIGDLLFRIGRYGKSVGHLRAGRVGDLAAARDAWSGVALQLPYECPTPEIETAELPLVEGALPELICSIGDVQHPFVLDTRATFSTVTQSLAEELGVTHILPAGDAIDGIGNRFPSSMGILPTFSVGSSEIGPLPVLVVEDRALTLRDWLGGAGRSPQALVGQDVLRRFRVTFDPSRRSVVFQPSRGLSDVESIPCLAVEANLVVPVRVEGRDLWFVLDTGSSGSSLSKEGLRALPGGELRAMDNITRLYSPSGASFSVRMVRGLVLHVSDVTFRGVDLPVVDRGHTEVFPVHGVLGADLIMRCRSTLDDGRIRIELLSARGDRR